MNVTSQKEPVGFEKLAVATTAVQASQVGGSGNIPDVSANAALVRNEGTDDVRWRDDGERASGLYTPNKPTSAIGNLLKANESLDYDGDPARLWFIVAAAGTAATVTLAYYRN